MGKTVDAERIARERARLGTFPAKWFALCGEPIDAEAVALIAPPALQRGRVEDIVSRRGMKEFLDDVQRAFRKLEKPLSGTSRSVRDLRADEEAASEGGGLRLVSVTRVAFRHIDAIQEHTEQLAKLLEHERKSPPLPARLPGDLALTLAAHELSEYLQARRRHRNDPHWSLVAGCLEWYGWGPQDPKALERRVARLRS